LVELVGIEKLGTLKTDKLLIRRESYNAQKASNTRNAGFIVRLLYGDFQSSHTFSRQGQIAMALRKPPRTP